MLIIKGNKKIWNIDKVWENGKKGLFCEKKRKAIRTKYGWKDKYIIGNVGRLHFQKNQSFALDIFAEYLKKNKNALLVLVGQGEDKRMLKEKADKLGIASSSFFFSR